MQAVGDLAQLVQDAVQPGGYFVQLVHVLPCSRRCGCLRGAQVKGEGDQALLGAVVQVALDAAARLVGGGHDPRPGGGQGGLGLGVGEGGRGQLAEVTWIGGAPGLADDLDGIFSSQSP